MRIRTILAMLLTTALVTGAVAGKVLAERAPGARPPAAFTVVCPFSHRAPDDPITRPGQAGASHLHDFFGNFTTDATSTFESLRGGGSRCRTAGDRSGYWVPTLFVDGAAVTPRGATAGYLAGTKDASGIVPPPAGLRALAGGAVAPGAIRWSCSNGRADGAAIPDCGTGRVRLHVRFPDCWTGAALDSPDHRAHLAYSTEGVCPGSHSVAIAAIQLTVRYPIHGGEGVSLSSGPVESAHASFLNAWDDATLAGLVDRCLRNRACAA